MLRFPLWDHDVQFLQWGAVLCASLAGAVFDLRTRRIPNALTLFVFLSGVGWSAWVGGVGGVCESIGGSILLALPFVVLFAVAGGGAGDAKLMGALGAWLGIVNGLVTLMAVVVAGALGGLVFALVRRRFLLVWSHLRVVVFQLSLLLTPLRQSVAEPVSLARERDMLVMPYGLFIFAGVCVSAVGVLLWRGWQ